MHVLPSLHALVVLLLLAVSHAHSTQRRPLRRVASPTTISLEILPRNPFSISPDPQLRRRQPSYPPTHTLRHSDAFRLIVSAYNQSFFLHLRPNDHLIHPAAKISYYSTSPDGKDVLTHSVPLLRESVRAYLGEVVAEHHSPTRMREDAAGAVHYPHPDDLGWARITVHDEGSSERGATPVFEGAFSARGVIYHIVTRANYLRTRLALDPLLTEPVDDSDPNLVIWRESDVMSQTEAYTALTGESDVPELLHEAQSCGHDRLEYNSPAQHPLFTRPRQPKWTDHLLNPWLNTTIYRRDDVQTGNGSMGSNFINSIGSTEGCPTTQRIIYMGVAADCTYVTTYGGQENATQQILNNWNSASALYKSTFNVSLGIAELQVKGESCPSTPDPSAPWNIPCSGGDLNDRLSTFSQWRGQQTNDSIGLWHLMSGCPTGSEVGIAWLATLCQQTTTGSAGAFVSGTAVSTAGRTEWQVVAHEIGHNFGAIHDCDTGCNMTAPCCPLTTTTCDANSKFIMSPVSQAAETTFSACSIGNICSVMTGAEGSQKLDASCLVEPDPSRQVISLQMCGNGIVEPGEDCDPGVGTQSNCCDVTTCKFKNGAICDPQSSPCCTGQCSFAPASQVCRPAKDAKCDTPEMCTGNSSACPADVIAKNGQSCGSDGLACASGQCTSLSLQCQTVGASMGLQKACPQQNDKSCQISCQDPTNAGACIRLTSLLIDGSPCGYGGTCQSGKCQSAGFWAMFKSWYLQNLQIAIPVTVVAGLLVLIILWFIVRSVRRCCGRRTTTPPPRSRTRNVLVGQSPMMRMNTHERLASVEPPFVPPAQRSAGRGSRSGEYFRVPTAPPAAHDRSRSGDSGGDVRYNYAANNHMDWVDDTAYNGPRR